MSESERGGRTIAGRDAASAARTRFSIDSMPVEAVLRVDDEEVQSGEPEKLRRAVDGPREEAAEEPFAREDAGAKMGSHLIDRCSLPNEVELQHFLVGDLAVEVLARDLQVLRQALERELHARSRLLLRRRGEVLLGRLLQARHGIERLRSARRTACRRRS